MKKLTKKLHTLWHLDWRWAGKYYKKKIKQYLGYLGSKLKGKKYWEVSIEGVKIKLSFSNYYQHHLANLSSQGRQENQLLKIWKKQSENKNIVVDLGGYNGIFGLISAAANPASRVYIFEPDTINYNHIKVNINLNQVKNVEVVKAAVADQTGPVSFNLHAGGPGGSIADSGLEVDCWKLDDFFQHRELPTLMKFDIEGAECRALLGAKQILIKNKPAMLLEVHQKFLSRYGDSTQVIDRFLQAIGYKKLWLDQNEFTTHYWVHL
ncbi:MAG: hypothetical protein A3H70_03750 [Candidatus Komeilibacteria bacterium RIFCSPLOWO2_02_FULL_48_11]|uniref:Methyltransferase FkbM domain-containing protein n=1 Tax=Candidatus Komeilibacteria bacterium RIFCSPLOWO2_02_FULL_48_11 TaxID=1798553 RepID=A0A1G2BP18_9BACT|nr:MAG: hypothetical protein A3H70_03750 [Candidatus Komeilibacteria bacterium RIFCSPLOWO2_02_FULL_48_11]